MPRYGVDIKLRKILNDETSFVPAEKHPSASGRLIGTWSYLCNESAWTLDSILPTTWQWWIRSLSNLLANSFNPWVWAPIISRRP